MSLSDLNCFLPGKIIDTQKKDFARILITLKKCDGAEMEYHYAKRMLSFEKGR